MIGLTSGDVDHVAMVQCRLHRGLFLLFYPGLEYAHSGTMHIARYEADARVPIQRICLELLDKPVALFLLCDKEEWVYARNLQKM